MCHATENHVKLLFRVHCIAPYDIKSEEALRRLLLLAIVFFSWCWVDHPQPNSINNSSNFMLCSRIHMANIMLRVFFFYFESLLYFLLNAIGSISKWTLKAKRGNMLRERNVTSHGFSSRQPYPNVVSISSLLGLGLYGIIDGGCWTGKWTYESCQLFRPDGCPDNTICRWALFFLMWDGRTNQDQLTIFACPQQK